MKKYFLAGLNIAFIAGAGFFALLHQPSVSPRGGRAQEAVSGKNPAVLNIAVATSGISTVTKVFDGDTIEISGGEHVRYIGMDAPEEWYSEKATAGNQCYASEAKTANERLVLGKEVRLLKDVRDRDIYGRLLRYVYVAGSSTEIFVNEKLVEDGFAKVAAYPPDVKFKDEFAELQKNAKENKRGLWSACLSSK